MQYFFLLLHKSLTVFKGRGVVHSEMPHGDEDTSFVQLWVNLKSNLKMVEPAYQVTVLLKFIVNTL